MNGPTKRVDHTREFVMRSWQSHSAHNSARTPDGGSHRQKKRNLIHVAPIATALIHPLWVNFQGRYSSDTDRNTTGISDSLKGINYFPDPSGNLRITRGTVRESARLATPARDTPQRQDGSHTTKCPGAAGGSAPGHHRYRYALGRDTGARSADKRESHSVGLAFEAYAPPRGFA